MCVQSKVRDERFKTPAGLAKLANTMVELFEQVRSRFSVDDQRHYLFTPRELTAWIGGLLRYDMATEGACVLSCEVGSGCVGFHAQ